MISDKIYKAQCFGNVEPIEYMVPYPNLRSLVVGQCIKFADSLLYKDYKITNLQFLHKVNQFANWLSYKGIKAHTKVLVKDIPSPNLEILSYAIWSIGAVLIISNETEINDAIISLKPDQIIDNISIDDQNTINNQSEEYITTSNVHLVDEALIYCHNKKGIILSHYNLLINAYGLQKQLNILSKDILKIDIPINTTAGIVLNTILPLYIGASISNSEANITFSAKSDADYQVVFDWKSLIDTTPQSLYILSEATAVLAIGETPIHVMSIIEETNKFIINGHSVMMGYYNKEDNKKIFKLGGLVINK